jgi:TonB-linked SusC/RagA family outer membrane protein
LSYSSNRTAKAAARIAAALALTWAPVGVLTLAPASLPAQGAQQGTGRITGTVTTETGQPLAGTQVSVVGTQLGDLTGDDGRYTIVGVNPGTVQVRAQRIGYAPLTQTVIVADGVAATANFGLEAQAVTLSTVVTVGYTSEARRDISGAVASVDNEALQVRKTATIEEAISGRAPGVQVQTSGAPGQASSIIVRGQNFLGNAQPLYVVDGLYLRQNPNLNPNDVESIQVLKDASAASQYGAQAANGVVVITTKRGQAGQQNRVTARTYYGYQETPKQIDMMEPQEWAEVTRQAYANARELNPQADPLPQGVTDILEGRNTVNNDWQDAIFQRGAIQNHNLQMSGGTGAANYLVSGDYFRNDGTVINTDFERYSFRVNSELRRGRFTVGENLALSRSSANTLPLSGDGLSPLLEAMRFNPAVPIRDSTNTVGGYGIGSSYLPTFGTNPVGLLNTREITRDVNQAFGTVYGEYGILQNLRYRLNLGFSYDDSDNRTFRERALLRQNNPIDPADLNVVRDNNSSLLFENLLSFDQTFGSHSLNAVAGYTEQRTQFDRLGAYRRNFTDESLRQINAGVSELNNQGFQNDTRLRSYLVRASYTLADRYLATASFRRDGSSRFGPSNRWGNFGAGSLGWIVSEEGFFRNSGLAGPISFLKLRASYGTLGNQDFDDYQFAALIVQNNSYLFGNDAIAPGAIQLDLANPNIKWQENTEQNYGLDLNFLDDRLSFTADYYRRRSDDLLVRAPLSQSLGARQSPFVNAGAVQNSGFELGATHRFNRGSFNLNTSANVTSIDQKVLSLGNNAQPLFAGGVARTAVGGPIGAFYVYKTNGLFQSAAEVAAHGVQPDARPGDIRYVDVNGDGVLNDEDRYVAGSPIPDFEGGFFLDGSFRQLDFNVGLRGSFGNEIFNEMGWWTGRLDDNANFRAGLRPWTPENPNTTTPRAIFGGGAASNARRNSDRWVEDGSYVRIQNVQLGYRLPAMFTSRLGLSAIQNARLYVNVQNVYTFTDYSGFDPEFIGFANSPGSNYTLERGIDFGAVYPTPRTFTFGLDFGL